MGTAKINLPPKLVPIFSPPRGSVDYRGLYGGRGSGKSYSVALMAAVWGYAEKLRILCTREFQGSIKESFHAELKAAIEDHSWLSDHYDVGVDYLRGSNGTEFLFKGLRHNINNVKSTAKIDLTIVEEAEDVPEVSWLALEATVFRQPKSELWAIWNPKVEGSPVDQRFRENPPERSLISSVQWNDNPFFPSGLETLRKRQQEMLNPADYAWIWEGAYLQNSDAQVLSGKVKVRDFAPRMEWDGPYYGLDHGYAQDPMAAVECWVHDDVLYISREAVKVRLELDETAEFVSHHIPGIEDYVIRADSARPESNSYLARNGLPRIEGVEKWKGSVEDGIAHLRSYREIVIHPRCRQAIHEANTYSYKVDRLTGDVLPVIIDANNHLIDAARYALAPLIKRAVRGTVRVKKTKGF
jgi:phage terminase large subunit